MKKQPPGQVACTVALRGGTGNVTLSVSTDLLRLSPADRKFVFGLIDQLAAYEAKQPAPPVAAEVP
jgi:hypothetical protein